MDNKSKQTPLIRIVLLILFATGSVCGRSLVFADSPSRSEGEKKEDVLFVDDYQDALSRGVTKDSHAYVEFPYREFEGYRGEYERAMCVRRLARIANAMYEYKARHPHHHLPPVYTRDSNDKPLHSWRVLILPYLGTREKRLYEQIRLGEPWDSEWNSQFHDKMPGVYYCGADEEEGAYGRTHFSVITGDGAPFSASRKDGLCLLPSFMHFETKLPYPDFILVIERNESVCWMKPDDELDIEEIISGEFLKKASTFPRHVDKNGGFYIHAFYYSGPLRVMFTKDVTQEQLSNGASIRESQWKEEVIEDMETIENMMTPRRVVTFE